MLDELDGLTATIGTRWHPQGVWSTTSKVVLVAIGIIVAAEIASADVGGQHSTFETLTGECTKVTLMDVLTDPAVCSDQVTAIRSGSGTLGYAFSIDLQGNSKPWIISFSGANLRHASQNGGITHSPYTKSTSPSMVRQMISLALVRASLKCLWRYSRQTFMFGVYDKGEFRWRIRHSPHRQRFVAGLTRSGSSRSNPAIPELFRQTTIRPAFGSLATKRAFALC